MSKNTTKIKLAVFRKKEIRRAIHDNEWWFSVVDIVGILIDQPSILVARKYWNKLSQRLREEGSEVVTNCHRLKLIALDGKMRETDCANTETIFRIIQSMPSPAGLQHCLLPHHCPSFWPYLCTRHYASPRPLLP